MQRKAVNPWEWSLKLGYNQGEEIAGVGAVGCTARARRRWMARGNPCLSGRRAGAGGADARQSVRRLLARAAWGWPMWLSLRVYATDVECGAGGL